VSLTQVDLFGGEFADRSMGVVFGPPPQTIWQKGSFETLFERRYITVQGLRLSYLEMGTASTASPSLVLLHGLMGCADTFQPMLLEFAAARGAAAHVIALDLPGAGGSERRDDIDPSLAVTADLVAAFIRQMGLRKPILAGHSHGGAVTMSVAARYRDLLHSNILIAPAHPWFDEGDPLIRFYLTLPGRVFAYTMPWFPEWAQLLCLRRMAGPRSCDTVERLRPYRENLRTPGTMSHLLRLLTTWHQDMARLARALRKRPLSTASLVIWGDNDRAVPVGSADALRENLGHSELIVLPGIGHRPAEEVPEMVAGLIHQWIESDLAVAPIAVRYSAKVSPSQSRIAALMTSSFEAGD
jgi:pimeloyl-ACP methyl ester carboxylesterase